MAAADAPVRYSEQELLEFEYAPDEQSDRVQQLQVILGVVADGWYGPVTQQAHTRRLNGEPALPACGGCVTVDIPAAGVSSSARPGGQSVIDGHRGIAVYSPLTNTSWGSPGILWLAGHRTSHGGIFEGVPNLPAGATITVTTGNGGVHRYSVIGMKVVTQDGYRGELNLNNQSTERLFIQTSHPDPYLRYIVEAAPIG